MMDEIVTIEVWDHHRGCQRMSFQEDSIVSVRITKNHTDLLKGTYDLFEKALTGADILNDISDEKLLEELSRRMLQR